MKLHLSGMTCGHCERAVRTALESVHGVSRVVEVNAEHGEAVIEGAPTIEALTAAIAAEGYELGAVE
ncbi:MAG: heavy-metal-associated domain-containing protein [Stellaceae bacterium]